MRFKTFLNGIALFIGLGLAVYSQIDKNSQRSSNEPATVGQRQELEKWQLKPGSGYDRGHLTPSGDRTSNQTDNSATFVMSNMMPQSPANNREIWRELEEYSRDLVSQGKELYIVAGGEGKDKAIANNKVIVPKYTWKVILVLDNGNIENTIAVRMPNNDTVARTDWNDYIVSVDEIEQKTVYDFFSAVPKSIQNKIEAKAYK